MGHYRKPGIILFLILMLMLAASLTVAGDPIWDDWDGRINVVDHFGGDVLYCTSARGCWLLNIHGQLLWEVPQSVIDAAKIAACDTGVTQVIEAGQGTYGPSLLTVSCDGEGESFLNLLAYDEWGKLNELRFTANYDPVGPPVSSANTGSDSPTIIDTDGDGIPDSDDECPTEGDLGYGIDSIGCPIDG